MSTKGFVDLSIKHFATFKRCSDFNWLTGWLKVNSYAFQILAAVDWRKGEEENSPEAQQLKLKVKTKD